MSTTGLWLVPCTCVLPAKSNAYLPSILGSEGSEGQNLSMRGRPPKTGLLFMSSQHIRAPLHSTVQHYNPTTYQDWVKQLSKRMMMGFNIPRPADVGVHNLLLPCRQWQCSLALPLSVMICRSRILKIGTVIAEDLKLGFALESCKGHQGLIPVGAVRKEYEVYVPNTAGFSGQICLKHVGRQASKPDAASDCCDAKARPGQRCKRPVCSQGQLSVMSLLSVKK